MAKRLMLLTPFECNLVEQDRQRRAALATLDAMFARGRAIRQARFDAPPVGGEYHCRECGHGTNASDRLCAACWAC